MMILKLNFESLRRKGDFDGNPQRLADRRLPFTIGLIMLAVLMRFTLCDHFKRFLSCGGNHEKVIFLERECVSRWMMASKIL